MNWKERAQTDEALAAHIKTEKAKAFAKWVLKTYA